MFTISKDFHFSASHQLNDLPDDHQCARLHGHNYIVRIHLASPTLNSVGFVQDYGELTQLKKWIDDNLDHRHLNNICDFNPTAENLARHLHTLAHEFGYTKVTAVSVSETPKTWATYTPEGQ